MDFRLPMEHGARAEEGGRKGQEPPRLPEEVQQWYRRQQEEVRAACAGIPVAIRALVSHSARITPPCTGRTGDEGAGSAAGGLARGGVAR